MKCTDFGLMLCDSNNQQFPCHDTGKELPLIYNNIPSVSKNISLGSKYIADHTVVLSTKFMPDNICVQTYCFGLNGCEIPDYFPFYVYVNG